MRWDTCNIFLSLTAQAKSANLYAERKKIKNLSQVAWFAHLTIYKRAQICYTKKVLL